MRFGILGPVEVATDKGLVSIGQPRHRAVLAYLLLHPNRVVTLDQVTNALWGGAEPATARSQVHVAVSMLRRELRVQGIGNAIATRPSGYQLTLEDDDLDADMFNRMVADAQRERDAGAHEESARRLHSALGLWRGQPLTGIAAAYVQPARQRLHEQRLGAYELLADAELALGRHEAVVAQLRGLIEECPLRERLVGQLMLALHRCGRSGEALEAFARLRAQLADEYGADPGPELQELHVSLLRGAHRREPSTFDSPPAENPLPVPRQLPAAVANFSGRSRQLAALDELIDQSQPNTVVISAIAGTAGVGKTALAVHWAHKVAYRYPDGQVYLNLQGFDRSGPPMAPAEAIRILLDALAPTPAHIPDGLDAKVGLYRSLLAGRRVLILLDNARDADQVRPLLPGSAGCLTIVTSRNQLSGLVAAEGAHPLALGLLPAAEARGLLSTRVGVERIVADADAVEEIITRCAGLPLALAILAARAAAYPDFPLGALAGELRNARSGLDALNGGDAATDIRAVFSWSYQTLAAGAAQLFRLLGMHTGPDFAAPAAASLLGVSTRRLRPLLIELTRAHLVMEHTPGRYAIHDLLRAFAGELVESVDGEAARRAAAHRLLDHYLHTALAADRLVQPSRHPITVTPAIETVTIEAPADHDQAMAWFSAEGSGLVATAGWAADNGFDTHAWQLAWTMENFLDRLGRWQDWAETQRNAVAAAERLADRRAQADAHRGLAMALVRMRRHEDAHTHYQHSLDLSNSLGDQFRQARTHRSITDLLARQGRHDEALRHAVQSLELCRAVGDVMAEARALNVVGWMHAQLGDYELALDYCAQSLKLLRELGNRKAEGHTLDSLGYIHHRLGDYRVAAAYYQQAVELFREVGDRYNEATALDGRGQAHHAAAEFEAASHAWRLALTILEDLHHPTAEQVRARLKAR